MYIKVNADGKRFALPVPNCFLTLGLQMAAKALTKDSSAPLDRRQIGILAEELKQARKTHGKLTLVDVRTAGGDVVKIVL